MVTSEIKDMGVFFVSEKWKSSECVYSYGDRIKEYVYTLEDVLSMIADDLRGWKWEPWQNADLVVIGQTEDSRYYVMNNPSEEAMTALAREYNGKRPSIQKASKLRLCHVTVRNMQYSGRESVLLEASVCMAESAHGYCTLCPTYMCITLFELYEMMSVLLNLKMIKLKRSKDVAWLLHEYDRLFVEAATAEEDE